ncbi:MAG: hypothetical protein QOJ09_2204, partial [Actinomycetota bacterium]|nr:hypothetical protein [Actinomycetota bacterium]
YGAAVSVTSVDHAAARATAMRVAEDQRTRLSRAGQVELLVTDVLRTIRRQ